MLIWSTALRFKEADASDGSSSRLVMSQQQPWEFKLL
jgi:hypothetical protein